MCFCTFYSFIVLRELRNLLLHSHSVTLRPFRFVLITCERLLRRDHLSYSSIPHRALPKTWPDLLLAEQNQMKFFERKKKVVRMVETTIIKIYHVVKLCHDVSYLCGNLTLFCQIMHGTD